MRVTKICLFLIVNTIHVTLLFNSLFAQTKISTPENLELDDRFIGEWECHETYKDRFVIKKLKLSEDLSGLIEIDKELENYGDGRKINYGLESELDFKIKSVGKAALEVYSTNEDSLYKFICNYIVTDAVQLQRLILFVEPTQFGYHRMNNILNVISCDEHNLLLGYSRYKVELSKLKKDDSLINNNIPKIRNTSKFLNHYSLYGKIKRTTIQKFWAKKLDNGTYVANEFHSIVILGFDKTGILNEHKYFLGHCDGWIDYDVFGDYEKTTMVVKNEIQCLYEDSIIYVRSDDEMITKRYKKDSLSSLSKSQLFNNQEIKSTFNNTEWNISYDENGDIISIMPKSLENSRGTHYQIIKTDQFGNWTKRLIFENKIGFLNMEIREVTYYGQ